MSQQQAKKRRRRYEPGSAYAGHVRPKGIFSIFGNVKLFYIVGAAIMLGSLGIGGFIYSTNQNTTNSDAEGSSARNPGGFIDQSKDGTPNPDDDATPETSPTTEVRRYEAAPAMTIDATKTYVATIKTDAGDIQVELLASQVPQTVNNFVFLANDGFYDGLIFHQVQSDFDAQAGDPTCTSDDPEGCRGNGGPGYDLTQEKPGAFVVGAVGMANGSQFFIVLGEADSFSEFTPFGRVTSGIEVAQQLVRGSTIESIEIAEQ
ncbi:MAG: peptidylprolyl isomerase [Dehalococcoidia bacterium]